MTFRKSFPFVLALFIAATPLSAQLRKGKDKEAERAQKEKKKDDRNLSRYEKLKEFSTNKYQNDLEFRDEVDQRYEDLMRDHSQRAYDRNTHRDSFIRQVHEDSYRVHVNLYDNLLIQDHINRIGQKLVPEGSERLFAFKVVPDPIPSAETLATGTIYVSTGLISLLDSEAQLAYVLGHEMAHVQMEHWKERVMMDEGEDAYALEQGKKARRWALFGAMAGAAAGAAIGSDNRGGGALLGGMAGFAGGAIAGAIINRPLIVNWDKVEEDKADQLAFQAVLKANYDVREVPKLYIAMENAVVRDQRVGLGFLGNRKRIKQRRENVEQLIANSFRAEIEAKLKGGAMLGDSAQHRDLMAELKRDNGIMAYYHDMYEMARSNLAEAVSIRDNDPGAQYYYGKVLKLIGRTDEDRKLAMQAFAKTSTFDYRNQNSGSHLHRALELIQQNRTTNKTDIVREFDQYVTSYARWMLETYQMRMFPPNMDTIYENMRMFGDVGWRPKPPEIKDLPNFNQFYTLWTPDAPSPLAGRETGAGPRDSGTATIQRAVEPLKQIVPEPVRNAVPNPARAPKKK